MIFSSSASISAFNFHAYQPLRTGGLLALIDKLLHRNQVWMGSTRFKRTRREDSRSSSCGLAVPDFVHAVDYLGQVIDLDILPSSRGGRNLPKSYPGYNCICNCICRHFRASCYFRKYFSIPSQSERTQI